MNQILLATAMLITTSVAALAIDFRTPITQLDGKPFTNEAGQPDGMTLGKVCTNALMANFPDEQGLSGDEKMRRFLVAKNIFEHYDYSLNVEEIALVKKLVGKSYGPLIVGQAWALLDPASVPQIK